MTPPVQTPAEIREQIHKKLALMSSAIDGLPDDVVATLSRFATAARVTPAELWCLLATPQAKAILDRCRAEQERYQTIVALAQALA